MKFSAPRETLLEPLQAVIGVVERRQTMPVLANVLLSATEGEGLAVTATDLEVELVARIEVAVDKGGEVTVPGRKLLDICRALAEGASVSVSLSGEKVTVRSGRSRFTLSTLPAADFPVVDDIKAQQQVTVPQELLHRLIEKTQFSMANQDVRYYLNGMLLEVAAGIVRSVATDGHRLALCELSIDGMDATPQQVILPRKGVLELQRLIGGDGECTVEIGSNHLRVALPGIQLTSKLIDGRFPDYDRVIPKESEAPMLADRAELADCLNRIRILANEKYKGVRVELKPGSVTVQAHNPEQEEAEEEIEVQYDGAEMEIGFNVEYLIAALRALDNEQVRLEFRDSASSCLIQDPERRDCKYVVMPMRL
ncbi:DNA polymerase III subunit beta [Thioalkalivibrio sp. XN8]|uniref:DNA polymerase III subunit beta n=1 Tax=Thioalkalivibrio sp. XN8 TaxID=2712863 RepID=UPI0013ECD164|nr:DNA polymerase III subunit beta [Thioalkalivibrio sp. XN8]NGP52082.1 DNA polymerase III subunit beta [Thioalkalivibrio sp. XN8]